MLGAAGLPEGTPRAHQGSHHDLTADHAPVRPALGAAHARSKHRSVGSSAGVLRDPGRADVRRARRRRGRNRPVRRGVGRRPGHHRPGPGERDGPVRGERSSRDHRRTPARPQARGAGGRRRGQDRSRGGATDRGSAAPPAPAGVHGRRGPRRVGGTGPRHRLDAGLGRSVRGCARTRRSSRLARSDRGVCRRRCRGRRDALARQRTPSARTAAPPRRRRARSGRRAAGARCRSAGPLGR